MIPNEALINFLRRELGYTFRKETQRVRIYRQRGGTHRIAIANRAAHSPEYVRTVLRSAGMPDHEIDRFLAQVNN